jgi:hypothetical protein
VGDTTSRYEMDLLDSLLDLDDDPRAPFLTNRPSNEQEREKGRAVSVFYTHANSVEKDAKLVMSSQFWYVIFFTIRALGGITCQFSDNRLGLCYLHKSGQPYTCIDRQRT